MGSYFMPVMVVFMVDRVDLPSPRLDKEANFCLDLGLYMTGRGICSVSFFIEFLLYGISFFSIF